MGYGYETGGQVLLVVNFESNTKKTVAVWPETNSAFSSVKWVLKVCRTQKALGMNGPLAL